MCNHELIKIDENNLDKINDLHKSILHNFGDWVYNLDELKETFINATPFEHIVIDNFLNETYANELYTLFPEKFDDWYKYENPIEVKFAYDDINKLNDPMKNYFYYLSSNVMVEIFRKITNISDLTYDEYLHGAGLHCHPTYGKLNIHLDYEKHPFSGKERRLNIILFLTKEWNQVWKGQNELWNKEATKCVSKTDIQFNRAVIFKTNNISWHGIPEKIICPPDKYRKTLAFYYLSPLKTIKNEKEYRKKAKYVVTNKKETDINYQNLCSLCEIRSNRRLTEEDIHKYYPDWSKEKEE